MAKILIIPTQVVRTNIPQFGDQVTTSVWHIIRKRQQSTFVPELKLIQTGCGKFISEPGTASDGWTEVVELADLMADTHICGNCWKYGFQP